MSLGAPTRTTRLVELRVADLPAGIILESTKYKAHPTATIEAATGVRLLVTVATGRSAFRLAPTNLNEC